MTKPIPPLPPDVADALAKGHLLEAVKRLRAASPMGLAEAKSVLEWHVRHHAQSAVSKAAASRPSGSDTAAFHAPRHHAAKAHIPSRPGLSPGEVPKTSGGGLGVVVLLIVAAGLVYYFLQ